MIRFSNNAEEQRSAMLTIQSKGQDLNAMYLGVKNLGLGGVEFTAMSFYDIAALGNPFLREPALIDLQMRFDQISSPQAVDSAIGLVIGGEVIVGMGIAAGKLSQFGVFARGKERLIPETLAQTKVAENHINGLRLKQSLKFEMAQSIFTENGGLTAEVIDKSRIIVPSAKLNFKLREELSSRGSIDDWAKYSTKTIPSSSDDFQMHYYKNSVTGEIYYSRDYKAVFNHHENWNDIEPNFNYEPFRFNP